ncbi:MAG: hypothetical protein M3O32_00770 [Actinomycetota bacterium]|nr:hypothetical protein [Actinomycetota bacterium]
MLSGLRHPVAVLTVATGTVTRCLGDVADDLRDVADGTSHGLSGFPVAQTKLAGVTARSPRPAVAAGGSDAPTSARVDSAAHRKGEVGATDFTEHQGVDVEKSAALVLHHAHDLHLPTQDAGELLERDGRKPTCRSVEGRRTPVVVRFRVERRTDQQV